MLLAEAEEHRQSLGKPKDRRFVEWQSRSALDRLLKLLCTAEQLQAMSVRDKVKHGYQSSLESQFKDVTAAQASKRQWLALTSGQRAIVEKLSSLRSPV